MLVIKKVRDAAVIPPFIQLVKWFINEKRMVVFVESAVMNDPVLVRNPEFGHIQEKLMTFNEQKDDLTDKIDFCCCLGGDGTLLYASSLFQQSVPPIMAFHLGSLGFVTPFKFEDFESQVTHVLEGHAALTLRSRLRCILIKKEEEEKGLKPSTNQLVLNEVVIDRGPSPYLSNIDLYLDGKLITSVQVNVLFSSISESKLIVMCIGRRTDRVNPHGQHGLRGGGRRQHDPPQRARRHGHPHLPPQPLLQVGDPTQCTQ